MWNHQRKHRTMRRICHGKNYFECFGVSGENLVQQLGEPIWRGLSQLWNNWKFVFASTVGAVPAVETLMFTNFGWPIVRKIKCCMATTFEHPTRPELVSTQTKFTKLDMLVSRIDNFQRHKKPKLSTGPCNKQCRWWFCCLKKLTLACCNFES